MLFYNESHKEHPLLLLTLYELKFTSIEKEITYDFNCDENQLNETVDKMSLYRPKFSFT